MTRPRILVVEDEAIVARDIELRLVELGYEPVGHTARGEEAVVLAAQRRPDLVLMDIQLAGAMDGIASADAIRRETSVPVVFLTAFAEDDVLARARFAEPFGYILKPFADRELRTVVEMAIQRHRTETKLRASEERYRDLVETSNDLIWRCDAQGCFTFLNRAWESALGYRLEEMLGRPFTDFEPPGLVRKDQEEFGRHLAGGSVVGYETVHLSKSGAEVTLSFNAVPVRDRDGTIVGAQGTARDITQSRKTEAILSESEERNRALVSAIPDLVFTNRRDGECLAVHASDPRLLQAFSELYLHRKIADVLPGAIADQFMTAVAGALDSGAVQVVNYPMAVRGEQRYFEARVVSLKKDAVIAMVRDVTERRQSEAALRDSEERYQRLIAAVTDYIYTVRVADGRVEGTSHAPGCQAVTGYRSEEFSSDPFLWINMVVAEDRPIVEEQARRILAGEDPPPIEHRIVHRDGTVRWVRNTFVPVRGEHGDLVAYDGLIEDITERRRAEAALQASEGRNRAITESAHDAIVTADRSGLVVGWNRGAVGIFGYTASEAMGQPLEQLIPERYRERHLTGMRRIDSDGVGRLAGRVLEMDGLRRDGSEFPLELSVARWETADGWFVTAVIRDISERRRAEDQKTRLETRLQYALKMQTVSRLAGGVAHDFNNMLGVILGHTELAMAEVDPSQQLHADLREIRKAAESSADLTRQLRAYARAQPVTPQVLNLNETAATSLAILRRLIGEDIDLRWLPETNLWPIIMDPTQIAQILNSLCLNARDAIAGVGTIVIETANRVIAADYCASHVNAAPGEYVRLTVSDTGCGMDQETLAQIFEPFYTTKGGGGVGAGLGLATVYGAVEQNHGFVTVASEPGQGTVFEIHLPRHVGLAAPAPTAGAAAPARSGPETILLVEDEPAMLTLTARMLEAQGYAVLGANGPGEAIRLAKAHADEIHLLLTDVIMPEMNGRDLANTLVSLYPGLKYMFMSGYTAEIIGHHGVLDEGVFFIQKPFSMSLLASTVRTALDSERW